MMAVQLCWAGWWDYVGVGAATVSACWTANGASWTTTEWQASTSSSVPRRETVLVAFLVPSHHIMTKFIIQVILIDCTLWITDGLAGYSIKQRLFKLVISQKLTMISNYSYLLLCVRFNGHFPGGPGLASTRMSPFWILLELRLLKVVSGNNWSYKTCKAPVKMSPPTNQHIQFSYMQDALPVAQPTKSKHCTDRFIPNSFIGNW